MTDRFTQYLIFIAIGVIAFVGGIGVMQMVNSGDLTTSSLSESNSCNVALIRAQGQLYTYTYQVPDSSNGEDFHNSSSPAIDAEQIIQQITNANTNPAIQAIVLQIDSNGGSIVAGQEIADELRRATKPTVALVRDQAVSSAYVVATGAKTIFASQNSEVGGIGVTASYLDQSHFNQKEGYTFIPMATGKYKDILNRNKFPSLDEQNLVMQEIDIMLKNIIRTVSVNRNIPEETIGPDIKSAKIFLGEKALELKLIDRIGDRLAVQKFLAETLNKTSEDIRFCN